MSETQYLLAFTLPEEHQWQDLSAQLTDIGQVPWRMGLHITLIPPFTTDKLSGCREAVQRITAITGPVTVRFDGLEVFGRQELAFAVRVHSVELKVMHQLLSRALERRIRQVGEVFPYRPHLTLVRKLNPLHKTRVRRTLERDYSFTGQQVLLSLQLYEADKLSPDWVWVEVGSWPLIG